MIQHLGLAHPLSLRKLTVLLHLSDGKSYKQVASALGISESMVRLHVHQIAALLPKSTLPPKDHVLLYCDRLLCAHPDVARDIVTTNRKSA